MADRSKTHDAGLVPSAEPTRARYDDDFYGWALEQARLVREGRWDAVDRDNVAEEIESLGREQFNKLESAFRVVMLPILRWDHQPALRSRSWVLSIKAQRIEIEDVLTDNPGLKPRIGEAIARGYRRARIEAARETGLDEKEFPTSCPYSFDDLVSRDFVF